MARLHLSCGATLVRHFRTICLAVARTSVAHAVGAIPRLSAPTGGVHAEPCRHLYAQRHRGHVHTQQRNTDGDMPRRRTSSYVPARTGPPQRHVDPRQRSRRPRALSCAGGGMHSGLAKYPLARSSSKSINASTTAPPSHGPASPVRRDRHPGTCPPSKHAHPCRVRQVSPAAASPAAPWRHAALSRARPGSQWPH